MGGTEICLQTFSSKSSMTRSFLLRSAPVGAVGRRRLESAREKSMFPFLFFLGSF